MPAVPTFTRVAGARGIDGTTREEYYDIGFASDGVNSNYITTGIPIGPRNMGLLVIFGVEVIGSALVSGAAQTVQAVAAYDYKTGKLQLFGTAGSATGLTEIANSVDIATFTFRVRVVGA
jgi:hypothetical protein